MSKIVYVWTLSKSVTPLREKTSLPSLQHPVPLREEGIAAHRPQERTTLMRVFSTHGRDLLKGYEALRLLPYDDQTGLPLKEWNKGATIGYGHLIPKEEWASLKEGITAGEAEEIFTTDLRPFEGAVREGLKKEVSQDQFDALTILAFNIGPGSFKSSSALKLVNDPAAKTPYPSLEAAWKAWNRSQGKVMKGLVRRRAAEWELFTGSPHKVGG